MRLYYALFILLILLTTSAQCQQTAEDWFDKATALDSQGKYEEAIRAYDEAIRLDPNVPAIWGNKELMILRQGSCPKDENQYA
jgi:tetratricopeptide (TPR) repeat protein